MTLLGDSRLSTGRWVYAGYWAWVPGPVYVRPVYAPALVAWFGGPRFGFGLSFGNGYGWCPLGYGEPFVPWYRGSRHYFRNVNITNTRITNITYVTNNYYNNGGGPRRETARLANLKAPGAVTAVPQHTIVNSLPVAREAVPLSAKEARALAKDRLGSKMDIPATRASMLGANAGRPTATPPEKTFARPVVSKIALPASPVRMQKEEVAELDKADRPMAAPKMEKTAPVVAPASGRNIPRPPFREAREDNPKMNGAAVATRGVPKPPTAGAAPEVRESHSGAAHSVPRPPENNRSAGDRPTGAPNSRISRSDPPETAERGPSASPGMGPVPRPPASDGHRDNSSDSDRAPSASPAIRPVPHASANDNRPNSSDGDSNRGHRTSLCAAQVPKSRGPRVQSHLHIRTRVPRVPHHGRARRLKAEVLHEAMADLRNPVLHRRVLRLQAMALLKAAQALRAGVHRLHLRPQLLKGARTNSRDETENAALRGGVFFRRPVRPSLLLLHSHHCDLRKSFFKCWRTQLRGHAPHYIFRNHSLPPLISF